MVIQLKKLIFIVTYNFSLFFLLIIGIQNSSIKKKVNIITSETVSLPISFVIGISFISGSLTSSILNIASRDK